MICMKNANSKTSSGKDKAKGQTEKKENPIRENENNSINEEKNDKSAYPHAGETDKQFDNQAEFIDRSSNSKDKS